MIRARFSISTMHLYGEKIARFFHFYVLILGFYVPCDYKKYLKNLAQKEFLAYTIDTLIEKEENDERAWKNPPMLPRPYRG